MFILEGKIYSIAQIISLVSVPVPMTPRSYCLERCSTEMTVFLIIAFQKDQDENRFPLVGLEKI